jgi:G3E family GTPase
MSGKPEAQRIPVIVITGFLGSGKTTLLQRLLAFPELSDTAVLINEFGEMGIDHHLIQHVDEDLVMLANGCVCCTIRDDLGKAMRDLLERRLRGTIPSFARLVIETTGLADPVPIIHTLITEPVVDKAFRLTRIVVTVDAVNGETHLASQPEPAKQAAMADRIVITKTDLAPPAMVARLTARLRRLNPSAGIVRMPSQRLRPDALLASGDYALDDKPANVREWLNDEALRETGEAAHHHAPRDINRHDERIAAHCLVFEEAIDWSAFCIWLTMLLHSRGEDVLRVKGLINVPEHPGPVVINGVQHIIHPPVHLDRWPDEDHRSRIVFITRDIARKELETSLAIFIHASQTAEPDGEDQSSEKPGAVGAGMQIGGRPYRRAGGLSWMK